MDPHICTGCGDRADNPVVEPAHRVVEPQQPAARHRPAPPRSGPAGDEHTGAVLVCARCGHRQPFRRLPLFALTGPSGAGKSTVGRRLLAELAGDAVVLEQDVLWTAGLRDPAGDHAAFRSTWLRMAAMIAQSGRPVVLCGTVVPVQLECHPQRVLFAGIRYLALVCEPVVLAGRLRARPAWRGWDEPRIRETLEFNDWLRAAAPTLDPPVTLLDTTAGPLGDTVSAVAAWVRRGLPPASS